MKTQTSKQLAAEVLAACLLVLIVLAWYYAAPYYGPWLTEAHLKSMIAGWGIWGPLGAVLLMIAAIVFSPIPSGPIAMVTGALYGPFWGAILVIVGAQSGALIAFAIARRLGPAARRTSSSRILQYMAKPHRQSVLMAIIFGARLMPFISFDAVSYAAGLTSISIWRFGLATALGVIPISFGLAYLGDTMIRLPDGVAPKILLAACLITAVPLAAGWLWHKLHHTDR